MKHMIMRSSLSLYLTGTTVCSTQPVSYTHLDVYKRQSKLLLLIGFLYLCYKGIVNISITFTYVLTVALLTFLIGPAGFGTGDFLGNLFGGGLILGACFMLTDYIFPPRVANV